MFYKLQSLLNIEILNTFLRIKKDLKLHKINYSNIRMKTSGRLKNFCQLCRKLCKDQNGYVCHINSVSHKQKVQQYKTNPQQIINRYSEQMQRKFIQILKTKYPGQAKHLQVVYKQYEQESKRFIKFNQTKWKNLKEFGQYLANGQVKNIKITGSPPDCYVTYTVNKTMEFIQKNKKEQLQLLKQKQKQLFEKSLQNKIQRQRALEQRQAKKFEQQMKKNQQQRQNLIIPDKLQFNFQNWGQNKRNAFITTQQLQRQTAKQLAANSQPVTHKKLQNSQKLLSQITSKQQAKNKKFNQNKQSKLQPTVQQQEIEWIIPGIIVKIKPHQIDPAFHNKKTKIISIVQPYVAKVNIGTATLQIDQSFLQTVIPKINNEVMILNGQQKCKKGILKQVDLSNGFGNIQLNSKIFKVPFNYFSKYQGQQ